MMLLAIIIGCTAQPPPLPAPPGARSAAISQGMPPDSIEHSFPDPLPVADAESILADAEAFDISHAGGWRPTRQIQAFNVLLDQHDAIARLRRLARQKSAAGRLYALCGLLLTARAEGLSLARSLSMPERVVLVRDADYSFETSTAQAIVLVFAVEVPERLRSRRDESYKYFAARADRQPSSAPSRPVRQP